MAQELAAPLAQAGGGSGRYQDQLRSRSLRSIKQGHFGPGSQSSLPAGWISSGRGLDQQRSALARGNMRPRRRPAFSSLTSAPGKGRPFTGKGRPFTGKPLPHQSRSERRRPARQPKAFRPHCRGEHSSPAVGEPRQITKGPMRPCWTPRPFE